MNVESYDVETIQKKFIELDRELDMFFQSVKEIKDLRNSISNLPDKLKKSEEEIENQRQEIAALITSAKDILVSFEERATGLFYDLEKKTETLTSDVRSHITEFRTALEAGALGRAEMEKFERMAEEYERIKRFFDNIKTVLDSHEHSINSLKDNYLNTLKIVENSGQALMEIQKTVSELKRITYEPDHAIKTVEAQMKDLFFSQFARQRKVIMFIASLLVVSIIFFGFYLFTR